MADETLDIAVNDNGSTTTVTNNLQKLAAAADGVATSVDSTNASLGTVSTELTATAASADTATTAVRGFVDANGNYIRQVGSNASATQSARTATDALKSSLTAVSIEQGRAAAGYGALNSATASSASSSAAFDASVRSLNTELGTFGAAAAPAAASTASLATATTAAGAAATGVGSATAGASTAVQSFNGSTTAGAAAVAAWRAANTSAGAAVDDHANRIQGARARYGAFNETIQSAIRQLGLLAVAFVSIKAADAASDQIQAKNALANTGQTAEQLAATMEKLGQIQSTLGTNIGTLANQYRAGYTQFVALNMSGEGVITMMQQIANLSRQNGASFSTYSAAAGTLFNSFKAGTSTIATLNAVEGQGAGFATALMQAYQQLSGATGNSEQVSRKFATALATGNINIAQFEALLSQAASTMNENANVGVTLSSAYNVLTGSLTEYVGTSTQGVTVSNLLSAAMLGLSKYPGVLVAGFTAMAIAIAAIGLAATVTAFTTLGTALGAIAGFFGITSAAIAVVVAGFTALVGIVTSLTSYLYNNNDALNKNAQSGNVVSQYIAILSNGIVMLIDWIGSATKSLYDWATSFAYVKAAMTVVAGTFGTVGQKISDFITSVTIGAKDFSSRFSDMKSRIDAFNNSIGTTAKPMASINQLMSDGSGAALQYIPGLAGVSSGLGNVGTSAGTAGSSLGSFNSAVTGATQGTGTFDSALSHLQQELNGTQAGVGEFTQDVINANAAMSNLEKSSNSTISAVTALGTAFKNAGNDAQFFALQSKDANTVTGQIGGGTVAGLQDTDKYALNLMGYGQNQFSPQQIQQMRDTLAAQKAGDDAVTSARNAKAAADALKAAGLNSDGTPYTGTTAAVQTTASNTTAVAANTAALTANTAANSNLPDLLTAANSNTTTTTSGLDPNGHAGVGASITQVTNNMPTASPNMVPEPDGGWGPSPDVVAKMNGGFTPGPSQTNQVINMTIKSDDFGQFKQSQRMIAQDIGTRVAMAAAS